MVHPYFDPALRSTFIQAEHSKDSSFVVQYFKIHGLSTSIRAILAISDSKWKNTFVEDIDWAAEKPKTPFGVVPILTETTADGKIIRLVESDAIERYLARKFNLLGSDIFEEYLINAFVSSSNDLLNKAYNDFGFAPDKAAALEKFLTTTVADWVRNHEKHLQGNGANGHHVGEKLSLADVKAHYMVGLIRNMTGDEIVSEKATPALWKLVQTLEKVPSFGAWVKSEEYKDQTKANIEMAGF